MSFLPVVRFLPTKKCSEFFCTTSVAQFIYIALAFERDKCGIGMSAEVNVLPLHVINWTGKVQKPAALLWPCESCRCQKCVYWFLYFQEKQ